MNVDSLELKDLTLEITRKCPLECLICSSNSNKSQKTLFTLSKLKSIIQNAIELGCESVALSGGEPLIYPRILDLCEYIKKEKDSINLSIYTCGNVIKNSSVKAIPIDLLSELKDIGVDKLVFSIHGGDKITHEKTTRVEGSFTNLISSISRAQKVGLNTELHFVPTKLNYYSFLSIVKLAEKMEIPKISILRFVQQGRGALYKHLELNIHESTKLRDALRYAATNSKVRLRVGAHYSCLGINSANCTAALQKATVLPDGFVVPCPSMKEIWDDSDANLKNASLSEIWFNSTVFKFVRDLVTKIPDSCSHCERFSFCRGGCPAQRMIHKSIVDPLCLKNYREILETPHTKQTKQRPSSQVGTSWECFPILKS